LTNCLFPILLSKKIFLEENLNIINKFKKLNTDVVIKEQLKLMANSFFGIFAHKNTENKISSAADIDQPSNLNIKTVTVEQKKREVVYTPDGKSKTNLIIKKLNKKTYPYSTITYANITSNNRIHFRKILLDLRNCGKKFIM
jgi:5,10-methylenetetrahydrofolate reductase